MPRVPGSETAPRPFLPYGRQSVDEDDVAAVSAVLRSDWLTTGPAVDAFEHAVAGVAGTAHAVALSSGTAALHAAMAAIGIGPGDEVVVPAITFAASANAVVYQGGTPVFADVDPDTLLVDPRSIERLVGPRTRAIIAVDYAGQPCEYDALRAIAARHGLRLVADACHALGAEDRGRRAGTLAELTAFSFHPVKHVTTAEGGAVATDDPTLADRVRRFRNHGIDSDHRQRERRGAWFYEMTDLGYNYRLSDLHAALGTSQMGRLPGWLERRRAIAAQYDARLAGLAGVRPLRTRDGVSHARHLYVVRIDREATGVGRDEVFTEMRRRGLGVNVHYVPVHLHPFYRDRFGTEPGLCPAAEDAYGRILSLPIFPAMSDDDVEYVVDSLREAVGAGA